MIEKIKVTDNFTLDEFCPKEMFLKIKSNPERLYDYLDKRIPILAQWIRSSTGQSVMVNNWSSGGSLDERCIRMPNTSTGASKSRHKIIVDEKGSITKKCDAIDVNIGSMTAREMYEWAKENKVALHGLGVRCIEHYSVTGGEGNGWLHLDLHSRTGAQNTIDIVTQTALKESWKLF